MFKLTDTLDALHARVREGDNIGIWKTCSECSHTLIAKGFNLVCEKDETHQSFIPLREYIEELDAVENLHKIVARARKNGFACRCPICELDVLPYGKLLICPLQHEPLDLCLFLECYRDYYDQMLVFHVRISEIQKTGFNIMCKACKQNVEPRGFVLTCPSFKEKGNHILVTFAGFFEEYLRVENKINKLRYRMKQMLNCGFIRQCKVCKTPLIQSKTLLICPEDIHHGIISLGTLEREFAAFTREWEKHFEQKKESLSILCEECLSPLVFNHQSKNIQKSSFMCTRCPKIPTLTYQGYDDLIMADKILKHNV